MEHAGKINIFNLKKKLVFRYENCVSLGRVWNINNVGNLNRNERRESVTSPRSWYYVDDTEWEWQNELVNHLWINKKIIDTTFRLINYIYTGLFEMMVGVLGAATSFSRCNPMWIFSMGLRQGSGLCSSSSRKYPGTEGTNQNRHWNHHRWHATNSLERSRLSCWCL